jgi:hypothetical protein
MASLQNVQTHAGHTVLLKIGGEQVGRAQTANARRSFGTQGVYEIGSIMPVEHIPLRYEGSVSMDKFLIRLGAVSSLRGILKKLIGLEGASVTDEDLILRTGILNIAVHRTQVQGIQGNGEVNVPTLEQAITRITSVAGKVIRAYLGCTMADYTESFRANALAGENATFLFLDCIDAVENVGGSITQSFSWADI